MPFYEYECVDCGGSFEVIQSIKADPVELCELCPGTNIRRKIFAAGMIFKGSGFYSTEYRPSEYSQQEKKESEAAAPEKQTDSTPQENKSTESETTSPENSSPPDSVN
ncbi:hypothetical protein HOF92_12485 [bacterium]|jgi:putative FmdB family regulatory protein|nr:hypothetical protein [bacterium]